MREIDEKPVRTDLQRKSLHKYLQLLVDELNNNELTVFDVLNSEIEIDWTKELVIELAEILANTLNDSGMTFRCVLGQGDKIEWTPKLAKELLWRKTQFLQYGITSTNKLDTTQVSAIHERINRHTAKTFGINVPFPEKDR